jgi:predicted nucleic acid-binding protein
MFYFDTSFLAPLFRQEASSQRVEEFMVGLPVGSLAVSHWTCTEFSSLLAREVRMGGLLDRTAIEIDNRFAAMVDESFTVFLPSATDFALARRYIQHYGTGLRAGDALHLAIASAHHVRTVCTLDRIMIKAGQQLGLPVSDAKIV